jgi:two-component system osmolarity sensor histidine kinase EnvZ
MIKRFLPKTLFGRSLIIIVTPVVLLQIIATIVFYQRHWDTVTRRMTSVLAGEVAAVIKARRVFNGPDDWDRMFALVQTNMDMSVTWEPGGRLPAAPPPLSAYSSIDLHLQQSLAQQLEQAFHIDRISDPEKINISVQLEDGVLHFLAGKKRVWSSTTYIFVLWMVGTSLVLLAIAVVFLRNQVRPIRRLASAAEAFGKGREETFLKPEGATEVRSAANAFLRMRERIQRQIKQRTEMLAGVSHDLRTPLTRMKLELAMLGEAEEAEALKADVAEMEHMIEGYLAFARGQDAEPVTETDLSEILCDVVADARRQGSEVGLDTSGDLVMPVRPNAIKRCLTNLVENARRYADHISITAHRRADAVEVLVDDDGPGIPEASRDDVFRAFFRLDESRNPETGGSGLGLTIARDVVRSHGGDIELETAPAGGLRARISLPL